MGSDYINANFIDVSKLEIIFLLFPMVRNKSRNRSSQFVTVLWDWFICRVTASQEPT